MSRDKFENKVSKSYDNYSVEGDYGDLWDELEPRLPERKRRKAIGWILFGFIIGLGSLMIYLTVTIPSMGKELTNDVPTLSTANEGQNDINSTITNQEAVNKNLELTRTHFKENKAINLKSDEHGVRYIKSLNDPVIPKVINTDLMVSTLEKKNIVISERKEKREDVSKTQLIGFGDRFYIEKLAFIGSRILYQIDYLVGPTPDIKGMKKAEISPRSWTLGSELSLLIPIWQKGTKSNLSKHGLMLNNNLELTQGIRLGLDVKRSIYNEGFYWGIGIQYSEIHERFKINNRVKLEEKEVTNKYALRIRDELYVASKSVESFYLKQNVLKYNKIRFLDFSPIIGYSYSGSFEVSLSIKSHINILQSYNGYLLDEDGLVLEEGEIFDEHNFQFYGLGILGGVGIPISDKCKVTGSVSYESRKLNNGETRNLQMMNILGFGLGIKYKIY